MHYVQPCFTAVFLMVVLATVLHWRAKKRNPYLLPASLLCLFLYTWPPTAWMVLQFFERPFPPQTFPTGNAQAIVVLASSTYFPSVPGLPAPRVGSDTYERCEYAAFLEKNWRPLPVLVTGGGGESDQPAYASTMKSALLKEGVPETAIWSEGRSRSTYENALYSAQILREKGISKVVLVTDAYHMLRAEKSFRKQGLSVIPAACGHRARRRIFNGIDTVLPGWEAIAFNEDSAHECVGLVWYWLHGWI